MKDEQKNQGTSKEKTEGENQWENKSNGGKPMRKQGEIGRANRRKKGSTKGQQWERRNKRNTMGKQEGRDKQWTIP